MYKNILEKSKSKIENALEILKLWEEDLKRRDEIIEEKVSSKENNNCQNISKNKEK